MENINTDIHELERGMELTKRESSVRKDSKDNPVILKDFLSNSEDKFRKLISDVKTAQVRYFYPRKCIKEYCCVDIRITFEIY